MSGRNRFSALLLMITPGAILVATALAAAAAPTHATLYAAPTATGSGSCSSWGNACSLQTALARASNGDQIWTRMGVNKPTSTSDPTISFELKNGVAVYGGFAGTETSLGQRDPGANITVLSGDIDNNDITNPYGVVTDTIRIMGDNSDHVVFSSGVNPATVLDGFTITAGDAGFGGSGGGMSNEGGSPTLSNLFFSGNMTDSFAGIGAGMYNSGGSPILLNVTFNNNSAALVFGSGGGLYSENGSPILMNVTFINNIAASGGGGMATIGGNPTLTDVVFRGNSSPFGSGSGLYNAGGNPTLTNIIFSGNFDGGMDNQGGSPTLTNVIFSENTDGGLFNAGGSPTLINVTFHANDGLLGGGMYNNADPTLTNITFSGNTAESGGGIYNDGGSPTLTNVILWGNTAITGTQIHNTSSLTPTISYSDIQGSGGSGPGWDTSLGIDGGGNIDADPIFVEIACIGLHLGAVSPAIDAGDNLSVTVSTDLDGNPRFVDIPSVPDTGNGAPPIVDMGAYEAQSADISPCFRKYFPLMWRKGHPANQAVV